MNYRVQGGFEYRTNWGLNMSAKGQYEQRRYTKHVSYEPESFYVRNLYNTYAEPLESGRYVSYFRPGACFPTRDTRMRLIICAGRWTIR